MILSYDYFILFSMTTISVPLPADLLQALDHLIAQGIASNRADAMRKALRWYSEQQAVDAVLKAMKEPSLHGDLDTLAASLQP